LGPDGAIALTYPFSANPTRYRVRNDDQVGVFAMRAGDGPSADCCCDYLNFFTDRAAGEA
jgi:hypothetical protein